MQIKINQEAHVIDEGSTVADVVARLSLPSTQGLAAGVNEEVIPKAEWSCIRLKEGDALLLIRAYQGG